MLILDYNNWNHLTVRKQISLSSFRDNVTYKLFAHKNNIWNLITKKIWCDIKHNQTKPNQTSKNEQTSKQKKQKQCCSQGSTKTLNKSYRVEIMDIETGNISTTPSLADIFKKRKIHQRNQTIYQTSIYEGKCVFQHLSRGLTIRLKIKIKIHHQPIRLRLISIIKKLAIK